MRALGNAVKPRRKQVERTELTRQKILSSAKNIFARDGVQAAKLEEIATRADYSRGAFYLNFKNKEELFLAVAAQQISDLVSTILQAVRSKSGLEAKCNELLRAIEEDPEVRTWALLLTEFNLFVVRQPKPKKHVVALYEQLLTGIREVFEDLYAAADRKPPMPLPIIGLGFGSLLQGLVLQEMLNAALTPQVTSEVLSRYVHAVINDGNAVMLTTQARFS